MPADASLADTSTAAPAPQARRKLIEVSLPLERINEESTREKSIRHGHPSTLHLWWARRPLAAARAVLFAQLVDDPSAHPDRFPTPQAQAVERERLHRIVRDLVVWENVNDEGLLRRAHDEIVASAPGGVPPAILDPFAGGGTIPLEAKRLGLTAFANDLNPVPVVINEVLLRLVDRFDLPGPTAGGSIARGPVAVAADLRFWAVELARRVESRVGSRYRSASSGVRELVYFWARTVQCPNPACGAEVPLVGQWRASGRRGSESYFEPVYRPSDRAFDVRVVNGTRGEPGATLKRNNGRCPRCEGGFSLDHVKAEARAGRMGSRLLAVQESLDRRRSFRAADDADRARANVPAPEVDWLSATLSTHSQYMAPPRYGLTRFVDLFSGRQLSTLLAFVDELDAVAGRAAAAAARTLPDDDRRYADGGYGAVAYGDAMRILLALSVTRLVNRQSTLCLWNVNGVKVEQVFSMQAYKMTWLFAEANPFGGGSGDFLGQAGYLAEAVERLPRGVGSVSSVAAQELVVRPDVVVSTDPPYYDSVPYADLSDFFVVWLRRMLADTLPSVFTTVLAPKRDELVADYRRQGGREQAAGFFETGLRRVFANARQMSHPYPMTVYYAMKANESGVGEQASTGWSVFLQALVDEGWSVSGTWPVMTEATGGLRNLNRNALGRSIVVVCRQRPELAPATTRRGFLAALRACLPQAMREMQQGSIAPVDLDQSAIGPGMAVFSSYAKVVEADGTAMSVKTALALINQALDEVRAEQDGDLDADTRFCLKWYTQYGWAEKAFGDADVLARATNTSVDGLARGGVLTSRVGRVRLLPPQELPASWDPDVDDRLCVWEVTMHLARVLGSGGIEAAGALMPRVGARIDLEAVHMLAYRLYELAQSTRPADALLFNALGTSWSDLSAVGGRTVNARPAVQTGFDLGSLDEA